MPAFLSAVFPECRSCPGISPQRFVLFGTLMSWRHFAGEHIPFGRSCTFQATESCDKYILAKKHDHSRISKRMENALKKQEFPRLWTSCVIIPSLTVNRRKNRRIPCIYWAAAIFSLLRTIVIYSFPLLFFWIVLILLLVMNW